MLTTTLSTEEVRIKGTNSHVILHPFIGDPCHVVESGSQIGPLTDREFRHGGIIVRRVTDPDIQAGTSTRHIHGIVLVLFATDGLCNGYSTVELGFDGR